jgi:hypothetical protein
MSIYVTKFLYTLYFTLLKRNKFELFVKGFRETKFGPGMVIISLA